MPQSLIDEISNHLAAGESSNFEGNGTEAAINNVLNNKLDRLESADIAFLDIMTRKIDIAGRVWARYDADWKSPIDRDAVSADAVLGIALCLSLGELPPGEDNKGRALKWINAAFNAVRLTEKLRGADTGRTAQVLALLDQKFKLLTGA